MNENEALKVVLEWAFDTIAQSNVYGEPLNTLYKVLGRAAGKLSSADDPSWAELQKMALAIKNGLPFDENGG